ncbi:MAG TPA: TonB-dependent receptor [Steroidobacteraceae bacterium]|nr:TonB-dependent receptor [Steroidobacteraceae bacterium]
MIQTMRAGVSAARTIRRTALLWVVATLGLVPVAALPAAAPAPATTAAAVGAIVGIVMDRAKAPIAHATVTALKTDGSAIRATISGSDGVFSFADLSPGAWTLSAQADGYAALEAVPLQVLASRATRHDLVMGGAALAASPASPKTAAPAVAAAPPAAPAPAPAPAATAAPAPAPPATAAAAATPALTLPAALAAPPPSSGVDNFTPFAYGDFTWLNGSPRNHMPVFDTAFFTPDIRLDASYIDDFNHPRDHTIGGSTEEFRSNEFQLDQISIGGDFHYDNVRARLLTMWGLFATAIPDNDASSGSIGGVGQYNVQDAYRYVSEANAGYHFDVSHGLNVDLGIFASYIGLFSFYNYDNWTYQPSYVSSNTPWVFNGLRIQWYPTNKLKIEPWFINGWASYNKFNGKPGLGGQILWMPTENLKLVFNNYGMGTDVLANTPGNPQVSTTRIHTDDSIEYKYFQGSGKGLSMAAFSLTGDAGCEHGGGVTCSSGPQKSYFLGWMLYNRLWFDNNLYAVTIGGGSMDNPGRYLTLLPPINGATGSTGSPYFTENPGQKLYQWDGTVNFQYMPKEWITWWSELGFRHSDVPYFSGQGGITPPGGNNGSPQDYVCNSGSSAGTNNLQQASANCGESGVWFPDLRKREAMWSFGVLVKF